MSEMIGLQTILRGLQAKPACGRRSRAKLTPQAGLPTVDLPPEWMAAFTEMQDRLAILERRDACGRFGKLFGAGSVVALLLAAFLISGTAWAYTGFGSGIKSCENWVTAKEEHYAVAKRARFHGWTSGYLTAYSLWVEQGTGPVSSRNSSVGAWAWIDTYCHNNPTKSVAAAAEQLILSLKDN